MLISALEDFPFEWFDESQSRDTDAACSYSKVSSVVEKSLSHWSYLEGAARSHFCEEHLVTQDLSALRSVMETGISFSRLFGFVFNKDKSINSVMWRTFVQVGHRLADWDKGSPIYFSRTVDTMKFRITHAFFMSSYGIYVIPNEPYQKGEYKRVSTAYPLRESHEWVRVKPRSPEYSEDIWMESQFLNRLHKIADLKGDFGSQYWAPPFMNMAIKNRKNQFVKVLFQEKIPFNARMLFSLHPIEIAHVFWSLAEGLDAMHRIGFVHGDIKMNNFMLFSEEVQEGRGLKVAKIIDFGFSNNIGALGHRGTYTSPEEMQHYLATGSQWMAKYPEQDSFALGMTILSLFCFINKRCIDDDPFETGCWNWVNREQLYNSHPLRKLFDIKIKWEVLLIDIYEHGVSEAIKKDLRDELLKNSPPLELESEENQCEIQRQIIMVMEILDIAFDLLQKAPEQRLSCNEAAEKFLILKNRWLQEPVTHEIHNVTSI